MQYPVHILSQLEISKTSKLIRWFSITVTGGAGTLALWTARALFEHGLNKLVFWDLESQFGRKDYIEMRDALNNDFQTNVIEIGVDVTDPASVESAAKKTTSLLEKIDILCCFAGVVGCQPVLDIKPEEWKRVMDVNSTGTFLCSQVVARQMALQSPPGGSIVHISCMFHHGGHFRVFIFSFYNNDKQADEGIAISAHRVNFPQPQAHYNASKASVVNLMRSMAAELAVHGIRVNSISPGYMDTILNEGDGLEKARRIWASRNPMGRMGKPWELQGVVVLLCSQAGSYVTGADFVVDGGGYVF